VADAGVPASVGHCGETPGQTLVWSGMTLSHHGRLTRPAVGRGRGSAYVPIWAGASNPLRPALQPGAHQSAVERRYETVPSYCVIGRTGWLTPKGRTAKRRL
jgi:hypothetical protein